MRRLAATVFDIDNNFIKIAYPISLFEKGNMPNILSSIAGNVFGLKALGNLRLVDIVMPDVLLNSFKGPKYGINGIRKLLEIFSLKDLTDKRPADFQFSLGHGKCRLAKIKRPSAVNMSAPGGGRRHIT